MPPPGWTLRCLFGIRQVLTLTKNQSLLISKIHFVESKLGFYQLKKSFANNNENLAQNLSVTIEVTIEKKSLNPEKRNVYLSSTIFSERILVNFLQGG